ncbi:MAG: phosphate transporter rane protein 2, PhoT family [Planctomycetaceae bacterium]|nr:phosphate transporter rane protein 2, PhoT family [Planctomycetaceae bacterium]
MARFKTRTDRVLDICVWTAPALVSGLFLWLVGDLAVRGCGAFWPGESEASGFFRLTEPLELVIKFLTGAPERAGRSGGIGPILVSTGLILMVCMSMAIPFGLGTALLLSEFVAPQNRFGRIVRRSLDVLAGVPSIVFGLFGNAVFSQFLGLRFSILSGGLTLACMVLPLLIRSTEEALNAVCPTQRHAATALGFSRWATVFQIILPQATPGVVVGLVLGIGRALAETAALIFTSGYVDRMPRSVFDSGRSLSIHIYDLSMNVAGGNQNAYASALVLITVLALINAATNWLATRFLQREAGNF